MSKAKHDIRSALGSISMAIDLLRSLPMDEEQSRWFELIKRNTDAALKLVDEDE